tara:strand:+ start:1390 stop:2328 length:939 start_codon:yes stop_codon:yes gene_type:complete
MSKNQLNIQELISQLRRIDVVELLDKAKSVKIENLRSLKLSDLKLFYKSSAFFPTIGILLASISTCFLLVPSYKSFIIRQKQSEQYKLHALELPQLSDNLESKSMIKNEIDEKLKQYKKLVITPQKLIYLTEIINETAKKTFVELLEFNPIDNEELASCSSTPEEYGFSSEYGSENDLSYDQSEDNFNDQFDDGTNSFDFQDDTIEEENIQIYEFYPSIDKAKKLFLEPSTNLNDNFRSNLYMIHLKGDYLNVLNFNRAIQDYQIVIIPKCFEPRTISDGSVSSYEDTKSTPGEVDVRIILEIPTKNNQTDY